MIAATILLALFGLVAWVNIRWRKELRRRSALPLCEQESLRRDDDDWMQRYSL